jgi:GTP cyclohydrolase I
MQAAVEILLSELGYDLSDAHFRRTPERVAEALNGFSKSRHDRAHDILDVSFEDGFSSLVLVGPIEYTSMCAHHLLPVQGKAYVGYLADGRICGLSKLARLVDHYARQLTVQERVTDQVADALEEQLKPKGCMVVIRAVHGCMSIRGVQDHDAQTTTSAVRGLHKDSDSARSEFLSLVGMRERMLG